MASVARARKQKIATVADLLEQLGGIPPERVWWQPIPGTATEQDVIDAEVRGNRLCELVDGTLVEKAPDFYQAVLGAVLTWALVSYCEHDDPGVVLGTDAAVRLKPGLVRIPDGSFTSWDRMPGGELPPEPIPDVVPELAVEILSAGNTSAEMRRKLKEYFDAGVRLVWVLDPEARQVMVHTSPGRARVVHEDGILTGGKVLPGFALPLRDWFARAGRRRRR